MAVSAALAKRFRTARKLHKCANSSKSTRGVEWAAHCNLTICPGEQYEEGDRAPDIAGGFGHDRFCMSCSERGLS